MIISDKQVRVLMDAVILMLIGHEFSEFDKNNLDELIKEIQEQQSEELKERE